MQRTVAAAPEAAELYRQLLQMLLIRANSMVNRRNEQAHRCCQQATSKQCVGGVGLCHFAVTNTPNALLNRMSLHSRQAKWYNLESVFRRRLGVTAAGSSSIEEGGDIGEAPLQLRDDAAAARRRPGKFVAGRFRGS